MRDAWPWLVEGREYPMVLPIDKRHHRARFPRRRQAAMDKGNVVPAEAFKGDARR